MTLLEQFITIAMVTLGTILTRFLPFFIFPPDKKVPSYVQYLGQMLPSAVLGMLVIYCLKDVQLLSGTHAVPELICISVVILLHLRFKQMLLSISGGTILYMFLVQHLF